ncbi:hypothetical protein PIB30_026331 [Stylosanthes scabra]|uniref:Uncharacterized protein n=1 Tax=Stylosanthes scabra TaxID=79078 RepID=A0ABU6XAJ6_9FABA|nr:hypothetical protein [Stylosanthes scabra]
MALSKEPTVVPPQTSTGQLLQTAASANSAAELLQSSIKVTKPLLTTVVPPLTVTDQNQPKTAVFSNPSAMFPLSLVVINGKSESARLVTIEQDQCSAQA